MEDNNELKRQKGSEPSSSRPEEKQNSQDRFGKDWEERAKQVLADIPFDSDLGREAARDAQRLIAGELSEEEFYTRYHDPYMKHFGLDLRPLPLDRTREEIVSDSFAYKPVDRRTLLKITGVGLIAIVLDTWFDRVNAWAAPRQDIPRKTPVQYGMLVDMEKCVGCLACVAACRAHNGLDQGVYWMHVISFTDSNQAKPNLMPRLCNHCTNAPCIKVCPVGARYKRDDGIVLIDYHRCIGCRYCMAACPYGVNYFGWEAPQYPPMVNPITRGRWSCGRPPRGVMGKCDFCPERQDNPATTGTTVCEQACPYDVLHFGNMYDPNSKPNVYLAQARKERGYISTFHLEEDLGTMPSNLYIGQQPSSSSELAPLPIPYQSVGWTAKRKDQLAIDRPPAWFFKYFGGK